MDNLTHSLSGAVAAKLSSALHTDRDAEGTRKTIFWLFILSANTPDIDVIANLIFDPLTALHHHRGITHSVLFAPALSLLPAAVFFLLLKRRIRFSALWLTALTGVLIHIVFDLITSFGTQIFAPFSDHRYALDWMFIVDPIFTGTMLILLVVSRAMKSRSRFLQIVPSLFVLFYLGTEFISHEIAEEKLHRVVAQESIPATNISVLPHPLSIFRWNGLVQTSDGVYQSFYSIFQEGPLDLLYRESSQGEHVDRALATNAAVAYLKFARHPLVETRHEDNHTIVELRDMQFTINPELLRSVGFAERSLPFLLEFRFDENGNLVETSFDGEVLYPAEL